MNPDIKELVQLGLREERLPVTHDFRTWGGPSRGNACSICGLPIDAGDIEIEVEWHAGGDRRTALLHVRCQAAWLECLRALNAERSRRHSGAEPA